MDARPRQGSLERRLPSALALVAFALVSACGWEPTWDGPPPWKPGPAGSLCYAHTPDGRPVAGCYPVSCGEGFRVPPCTTDADCSAASRCVTFQTLSASGPTSVSTCMKKCTTDLDCGRIGRLSCDTGYHVCTDFQGEYLGGLGTFGGHAKGGGACSTGTPPRRSSLFAPNVVASDPAVTYAGEVSAAIDPTTTPPVLYVAYNIDGGSSEISRSEDGGATWTVLPVPDAGNIGDPSLAVDPSTGELYYAYIGSPGACRIGDTLWGDNEIHLVWSTDHGTTFHGPEVVNTGAYEARPGVFMDKPEAVVGPEGDVYVTFDALQVKLDPVGPSDIVLARSTDRGMSFTDVRVNDRTDPVYRDSAQPVVDAAGDVWVIWNEAAVVGDVLGTREAYVRIARSADHGRIFGPSTVVDPDDPTAVWPNAIAVSPDGTKVFVAYQDWTGAVDVFDVKVAYSLDGGATFERPVKVNDDGRCATHWLPAIALGPAEEPWVIWYDNRYGDERVFGAEGTLAGQTLSFGRNFAVTDGSSGPFSTGRDYATISDYLGLSVSGSLALAGWADLRDLGSVHTARVYTSVGLLPR